MYHNGSVYFDVSENHPKSTWHIIGKLVEGHAYWHFKSAP